MENYNPVVLSEILFGSAQSSESKRIQQLIRKGLAYKIAPRVYTTNLVDNTEAIVKRNWFRILSNLYPDAVLSHRSALECKPTASGHIFATYSYTKIIELPGLTIHLLKGRGPILDDMPFFEQLYRSQDARAFLENCMPSRKDEEAAKTLRPAEIIQKLAEISQIHSDSALIRIKEQAKVLAPMLGLEKELGILSDLIYSVQAQSNKIETNSSNSLTGYLGKPFHLPTIKLLEELYGHLAGNIYPRHPEKNLSTATFQHFAFFESYFSQFIEGNEFELSEARHIVETASPITSRIEDAEDLLHTYQITSNKKEINTCPITAQDFIQLLQARHAFIFAGRKNKNPGNFKERNNLSGNSELVPWQLIEGTLIKGFDWYTLLQDPFAKAIYVLFLITEVSPFADGNGVLGRMMMNAELSSKNLTKIIIPTVYSTMYELTINKISLHKDFATFIESMLTVYAFSATVLGDTKNEMERYLRSAHAFYLPSQGKLRY
ncbi:Fic family protein [Sediminibacterium sp.]|uniref:Fic family protein n=1 Tax=Sediminibacterium sp. TaxID=1917865 RepID=UPI003F705ECE